MVLSLIFGFLVVSILFKEASKMSMYDRRERKTDLVINSTAPIVGPGSYDVDKPDKSKLRKDGYAPFNSLASRHFSIGTDAEMPTPWQYEPNKPVNAAKTATSLKSTTARFNDPMSDTPGPGTYNVQNSTVEISKKKASNGSFSADKNVLVYKNIRFERKYNVPSIPVPNQSHGYEEDVKGDLVRQGPPERDDSLGPAYYNANIVSEAPTGAAKYKGIHWAHRKSKRDAEQNIASKAAKDIPGPGAYEIPSFSRSATDMGHGVKHELKIQRFMDAVVGEAKKRGGPGPGWYQVKGSIGESQKYYNAEEGIVGPVERPPFMSSESRFKKKEGELPGPGAYSDPRTALESLRRVTALKRQPFGQTSSRFQISYSAGHPGPAAYNPVGDMARESLKKAFLSASQRGAFGTSSRRSQGSNIGKDSMEAPGPGHYDPKLAISAAPRYVQMSSTFASTSKRDAENFDKSIPPPGSYDVQKSYQALANHKTFAKPRTDEAWRRQSSFGANAERWRSEGDLHLPGPGQYDTDLKATAAINVNKGQSIPRDTRFRAQKAVKMPGPADYTLSPLLQDTVLRGTFNVTLGQAQLVK